MFIRLSFASSLLLLGCVACAPRPGASPAPVSSTAPVDGQIPPTETSRPAQASGASAPDFLARMVAHRPGEKAAPAVSQEFGRLLGKWACKSAQRQPDGTFTEGPKESTWTWFYTLDGTAIQDVWEGAAGGIGTNLRVYDKDQAKWFIVWATTSQRDISQFTAVGAGADIVMTGEQPARAPFPAHQARITFHDISAENFSWKYEATAPGGGTTWQEVSRISCRRLDRPAGS